MSSAIHPSLVGRQVVIEVAAGKVEGEVRSVDPTCTKIVIVNGILNSAKLPGLYRIFSRDINSVMVKGGMSAENEQPLPLKTGTTNNISPPSKQVNSRNGVSRTQKCLPPHIRNLDNNIEVDILTNRVPQKKADNQRFFFDIKPYTVVEKIDGLYNSMISNLEQEPIIGLSMEGVRVARKGLICWIGVAVKDHVYLLDMCSLGPPGVERGLKKILENPGKTKVTHDCRFMSDAFLHQYHVKLENVFDTQVAAAILERSTLGGAFNRFVPALTRCLSDFLGMSAQSMFQPRVRAGHEKEDEARWQERPLPKHLLEGAVFNVCHLRNLRLELLERLLADVTMGTELYLKEVSLLPDDECPEKETVSHLIPRSFEKLARACNSRNGSDRFVANVRENNCDPYVSFTRHIPHVKKTTPYI